MLLLEVEIQVDVQDCQLVFSRADQLDQLQNVLQVPRPGSDCLPDRVQLHLRAPYEGSGRLGLQLVLKRAPGQVCTLPLDLPAENALAGFAVFRWVIRVHNLAIPWFRCVKCLTVRYLKNLKWLFFVFPNFSR